MAKKPYSPADKMCVFMLWSTLFSTVSAYVWGRSI